MPLHDVLERVALGFLEIVAAVQRVEPGVQEELGPVGIADEQASARQTFAVLREHEIDALAFEVREGLDDAVGGHDGLVGDHEGFEFGGLQDYAGEGLAGVHDQGGGREVEDPMGVWVEGQGVAESGHGGPGGWHVGHEIVVCGAGEEGLVAMALGVVTAILFDVVCVRGTKLGIDGRDDDDLCRTWRWDCGWYGSGRAAEEV